MKIISISLDKSILDKDSILAKKTVEYAGMVEKYYVIVPSNDDISVDIASNLKVYGVGGVNRPVKLYKMYVLAKLLAKKYRCDVVTTQDPFELGLIGYLLKKKYKIFWNVQEHGDFFSQKYWRNESFLNYLRFILGRFLIKRADSIRAVSKRIKEYLAVNLHINEKKIIVVPVETRQASSKNAVKQTIQVTPKINEFIFLNMGRFVKQKNLPLLINAFAKVREKHPEARLRLVGRGLLENELRTMVKEKNIEDSVEFISWTDDVNNEYKNADVYVLSSNYEGWGRVIVEAALNHLPIVMTDVGCAGELIIDEASGLVVPVGDGDALASAMIRMIEDDGLRLRLCQKASLGLQDLPDKDETLRLYKESWGTKQN